MMSQNSREPGALSPRRQFLAIARGTQHAASHVTNDSQMFGLVCEGLRRENFDVHLLPESELDAYLKRSERPERVVSMAQRPENVALLERLESEGTYVVNSSTGVVNCYRTNLVERLRKTGIPFAESCVCAAADLNFDELVARLGSPFWIKRGDVHAAHANDVRMVSDRVECQDASADFLNRGISKLVAQSHIDGRVVKFYAVCGGRFFHIQDFETGERLSSVPTELPEVAELAARNLELGIYGGDAVLTSSGFQLIDFNPWPSFGKVREQAAPAMVRMIVDGITENRSVYAGRHVTGA